MAYSTIIFYAVGVALIFYYASALVPFCGACSLVDTLGSHNLNDPFIIFYYLLWTLFFYLPESFLVLFFIFCYFYTSYVEMSNLIIVLCLLNNLYIVELVDFIQLNSSLANATVTETSTNTLLLNPLNRYHPFIFYSSVAIILYIVIAILIRSNYLLDQLVVNSVVYVVEFNIVLLVLLNWLALWLGSWWAFQEGTWGGWWNSDTSEMLGLLIILIGLTYLHINAHHLKMNPLSLLLLTSLSGFLCTYYFIQINYELTSHNFGSRFLFFFNNNLLLLELLCALMLSTLITMLCGMRQYVMGVYIGFITAGAANSFSSVFFNLKAYLLIFLYLWLLISLLPLIDLFTQKYVHVADLLLSDVYPLISLVFLVTTVYMFFEVDAYYISSQLTLLSCIPVFSSALITSYYLKWTSSSTVHLLLTCFLLVNIQSSGLVFLYWGHSAFYSPFYFSNEIFFLYTTVFVCDVNSFNSINLSVDFSNIVNSSWTSSNMSNSYDLDQFWLSHSPDTLFNYFYFLDNWINIFIFIESTNTNVLGTLPACGILFMLLSVVARYAYSTRPRFNY